MSYGVRTPGKGLLWLGALAVTYGIALGPSIDWMLGRETTTSLYIVCIAVGLMAGVCGYGRMSGWSR